MANNMVRRPGETRPAIISHPSGAVTGDAVRVGLLTGVALTDADANELASVDFGPATWLLEVAALNAAGDVAIAVGDAIYYNDGDTPPLNRRVGVFFGIAEAAVDAGETAIIEVNHVPGGGAAALGVNAPGWLAVPGGIVIDISADTESGAAINRLTGEAAVLPAGTYVERIDVVRTEAFTSVTNFTLGKTGEADWLISNVEHSLTATAPGAVSIVNSPVIMVDTPLLITMSQAGNTTGAATIFVRYSTL